MRSKNIFFLPLVSGFGLHQNLGFDFSVKGKGNAKGEGSRRAARDEERGVGEAMILDGRGGAGI